MQKKNCQISFFYGKKKICLFFSHFQGHNFSMITTTNMAQEGLVAMQEHT